MMTDCFIIDDLIEMSENEIRRKLPEASSVRFKIEPLNPYSYKATAQIKGFGKPIVLKEKGEDCYSLVRSLKRKAISRAHNRLRKNRSRWRTYMPTAS